MFNSASEYDRGITTFSPEGRIHQVLYAVRAVELGTTSIGICCKDGVVLAAENVVQSKLCKANSIDKLSTIDSHIATCFAGLTADARTLTDVARVAAQDHRFNNGEPAPVIRVARAVADECVVFGEPQEGTRLSRPYGATLLIAGVDKHGPQLFSVDPSGSFTAAIATATGSGYRTALKTLERDYTEGMTTEEGLKLAVSTLRSVMEDTATSSNLVAMIVHQYEEGSAPIIGLPARVPDQGYTEYVKPEVIERLLNSIGDADDELVE